MKETKFKMTEIGLIPQDWSFGCFEDFLTTFSSGATPYRAISRYYTGSINWISSGELNYNSIHDTNEHISPEAVRNTNLTIHQPGTFLMAITGLEAAGTRGRCAMVGTPSTTNQSCLAINSTKRMTTDYLFWFYQFWSEMLAFKYSQGSKQQSFTSAIVRKLPIYAPKDLQEQTRIASALSEVDALLTSIDKLIAKKQAIKEGTMQQLLTGKTRLEGFDGEWEGAKETNFKMTEIGLIPQDWEVKSVSDIADNYTGLTYSPEQIQEHGTLVLRSSNIQNGALSFKNNVFVKMNVPTRAISKEGDVLVCVRNGSKALIGKSTLITKEAAGMAFGAFMTVLRAKDIDARFCLYAWQSSFIQNQVQESLGATINQITSADFKKYKVSVPINKFEQQAIASILTSMDSELSALQAKRKKYEAIKQGMMQQLLTGKVRLI